GCNVTGNITRFNGGFGLNLAPGTGYSQNVIYQNTGGTVFNGVSGGPKRCNAHTALPVPRSFTTKTPRHQEDQTQRFGVCAYRAAAGRRSARAAGMVGVDGRCGQFWWGLKRGG